MLSWDVWCNRWPLERWVTDDFGEISHMPLKLIGKQHPQRKANVLGIEKSFHPFYHGKTSKKGALDMNSQKNTVNFWFKNF